MSTKFTKARKKLIILFGVSVIVFVSVPTISADVTRASSMNRIMVTSQVVGDSGRRTIYSLDESYGGYNSTSWVKQVSSDSDPYISKVGGDRMAVLLNDGTLLAKDSTYSEWVVQAKDIQWMDIGDNSEMMVVNSAGNAYSKTGQYATWVQQTTGGGVKDVAVGGNGRLMVIDSADNAYSKDSTYDAWIKQVSGASSVFLGRTGQMGVINTVGDAYTKFDRLAPWVQQTSGGGTKYLAIGGTGRLMVIDSDSNAYSKESTYDAWVRQVNGARDVDVSPTGRMVVVNSNYDVYYKDSPTVAWREIYQFDYPEVYNLWLYIN